MTRRFTIAAWRDANLFLHKIDTSQKQLLFAEISRSHLSSLPFHDGRFLKPSHRDHILPIQAIGDLDEADLLRRIGRIGFVFNTAFCGSTWATRMLDLPGRIYSLREPKVLTQLAHARSTVTREQRPDVWRQWRQLMLFALASWSQTAHDGELLLIKPTSWELTIMPELLEMLPDSRAIFLYNPLEAHSRAVLKSPPRRTNRRRRLEECAAVTTSADLRHHLPTPTLPAADPAMTAWEHAWNIARYDAVAERFGDRIRAVSSVDLFGRSEAFVAAINEHFGVGLHSAEITAAVDNPALKTDVKAESRGGWFSRRLGRFRSLVGGSAHNYTGKRKDVVPVSAEELAAAQTWLDQNTGLPPIQNPLLP